MKKTETIFIKPTNPIGISTNAYIRRKAITSTSASSFMKLNMTM